MYKAEATLGLKPVEQRRRKKETKQPSAIDLSIPTQIEALKDYIAIDIAAGMTHVVGIFIPSGDLYSSNQHEKVLATEGTVVMVWGRRKHGCLDLGGSSNELLPCENIIFRGLGAVKAAAGTDHSLVLCGAGSQTFLYAFEGNHSTER
ncbi:hypothetical protein PC113_g25609 [Phytophthora cactorum]|uniref:Regulator of chromosome condensation 1/beta-lactamase-inhibitor protein II n=2 Tax=Phytophthora cactorum TaxID=29920 RepID=A0A8T0Y114_9STRA|nr:hypothetical protein PC112_g25699 [Phytophthora cactorum]KAG2765525.1 hypothetical protein PC111_g25161 [Phytophthora cactorum]KAG2792911.1 hypothetical protein PC113_g25609 [Phytophthora cactorum]KAG2859121.1 hypothetical protein PC115_g25764 [Phytophthora cactorum]KAG3039624.1 hypothetical protein PC122_g25603 [Phytophthora cactorum]